MCQVSENCRDSGRILSDFVHASLHCFWPYKSTVLEIDHSRALLSDLTVYKNSEELPRMLILLTSENGRRCS